MSIPKIASPLEAPRPWPFLALLILAGALPLFGLTSCANFFPHQFLEPSRDWQARNGQLLYRNSKTTLIGEVLVRFSKSGEFELTFSKGPGVTLLTVRQDDKFVRVSGPLARGSWSGPPSETPTRLRGWISLREVLMRAKSEPLVRQIVGPDRFTFAF